MQVGVLEVRETPTRIDVGALEIVVRLAVVVPHRVVDRRDAQEVALVQRVLPADLGPAGRAQQGRPARS